MRRVAVLLLMIGITACHIVDLTGLCLSPEGCQKKGGDGNGNQITYVAEQVTINRGGVLVPDTVKTRVGPTPTQQPAINWVNLDTLTHRFVSDSGWFDSGNISPYYAAQIGLNRVGTLTYHCMNHPWMVGTIVVP